jgi:glycosyltransferase involved in cell wall biosynthesis
MRVKQVWLRTVTRWTLHHADAVWFTSAADQARLAPTRAPGVVMEDGVDLEPFLGRPRHPEAGSWLVPGRVDVHKGLDDLIEVVAELARRGRAPTRVEITGASRVPGLIDRLRQQAERRGVGRVIRFVGVLEPEAYAEALARCELALLPSRREGFGIAAVEAMAAGAPVVLADIPAFRDRVRSGVDGWLARFRIPGDAARLLIELPSGPSLQAVGEAARERSRRFSWRFRVRGWEAAYRALVAR